jgi:hypothetical protein
MATNKRIINENGLVKMPTISTGRITIRSQSGTPGVQKT